VLVIAGSGNDPDNKTLEAAVWAARAGHWCGPSALTGTCSANGMVNHARWAAFCSWAARLKYDDFLGYRKTAMFNPATGEIYQHAGT